MANLAQEVLQIVDTTQAGFVESVFVVFEANVKPFFIQVMTISIIFFGLLVMGGYTENPGKEFFKKLAVFSVIMTVAFNWSWFSTIFYELFTESPERLGELMLAQTTLPGIKSAENIDYLLGDLFETGMVSVGKIWAQSGWQIINYIIGIILFLGVVGCVGYMLALIVLAKIGTAVVLAVGPIFIMCSASDTFKHLFSSWLAMLLNFAFTIILTYLVAGFMIQLLNGALLAIPEDAKITFQHVTPIGLIFIICIFVLAQIPGISAGLTQNIQISTLGAVSSGLREARRELARGKPLRLSSALNLFGLGRKKNNRISRR